MIDYIFPYVNPEDKNWQKEFKKYHPQLNVHNQRYRDLGLLKYVFRGLDVNMPWLNQVIFIVSSQSQVPTWLNTEKVRVVTHDQFIPSKYLPTFNSNTIEMFLANIPNLSEKLIYGNDDFFFINSISETYFFENDLPKISYKKRQRPLSQYQKQCLRDWKLIENKFAKTHLKYNEYYNQLHGAQPILLSSLKEASEGTENERLKSITQMRSLQLNYSQHLYFNYCICTHKCIKRNPSFFYTQMIKAKLKDIVKTISGNEIKEICLNDTIMTDLKIISSIQNVFEKKFPNRSKYEIII